MHAGRSGSTRCSSRRAPSSWPRTSYVSRRPTTSAVERVAAHPLGHRAELVEQRRRRPAEAVDPEEAAPRVDAQRVQRELGRVEVLDVVGVRRRDAAGRRGRRSTSGTGSAARRPRTAPARASIGVDRDDLRAAVAADVGERAQLAVARRRDEHGLAVQVDDGQPPGARHPCRRRKPEGVEPADAGPARRAAPARARAAQARRRRSGAAGSAACSDATAHRRPGTRSRQPALFAVGEHLADDVAPRDARSPRRRRACRSRPGRARGSGCAGRRSRRPAGRGTSAPPTARRGRCCRRPGRTRAPSRAGR